MSLTRASSKLVRYTKPVSYGPETVVLQKHVRVKIINALPLRKVDVVPSSGTISRFYSSPKRQLSFQDDSAVQDQQRKANLGKIIEEIKCLVPGLLTESLPATVVAPDISLRICPTHLDELNSYLPAIKGRMYYYTACKAVQKVLTSIVLSPKVQLHIQSLRVSTKPDQQAVYPDTTKIYVRWNTCSEGCSHLTENDESNKFHSTSAAKLGSHRWSKLDTLKILGEKQDDDGGVSKSLPSVRTVLSQMSASLVGLSKENQKLERVLSGIFIFELTSDNDQILVHTIENVDLVERREEEEVPDLRIC